MELGVVLRHTGSMLLQLLQIMYVNVICTFITMIGRNVRYNLSSCRDVQSQKSAVETVCVNRQITSTAASSPFTIQHISNISLEIPPHKFGSPSAFCFTTLTSWSESGSQSSTKQEALQVLGNKSKEQEAWLLLLLMNYDWLKQSMILLQQENPILANFEAFQLNTEFMQKKLLATFLRHSWEFWTETRH
jgi:Trk-type K+ transport system membrane component